MSITPFILDVDTRWRGVVNFTLWPLYSRKELWYPLNRRRSGLQDWSGRFGDQKKFFAPTVIQTPDRSARSLDAISTAAFQSIIVLKCICRILARWFDVMSHAQALKFGAP